MFEVPRLAVVSLTVLLAATLSAAPAVAQGDDAPVNRPGVVIVGPADAIQVGSATFYPTGPIDEDTLVVVADDDGNLPGGITEAQLARIVAARAAGDDVALARALESAEAGVAPRAVGIQWAAPLGMVWGLTAKGTTALTGTTSSVRVRFTFGVNQASAQVALGRAIGYYMGYNGGEYGKWSAWYGVGTASAGSDGTGTVPWGNTMAVSQFQGKSMKIQSIAAGQYSTALT